MTKRRIGIRQVVAIYWRDIESNAAWGKGSAQPPCCITFGIIRKRPSKKEPWYIIASSWSEEAGGSETIIPKGVVMSVEKMARAHIPWRPDA